LFTLDIPDSKEQISAALETQAALETKRAGSPDSGLIAYQLYLQLKAPIKVLVPYARELAAAMAQTASAPRILRDFARLLSLIKVVALLRHHRRHFDSEGRIVADLADYETVRELVNEMYIDSSSGAVNTVRVLVEAVTTLDASRAQDERITNSKLARSLELPVMTISRRAKKAIKQGWLVNREQRKYFPADYAPGEPMPAADGLPLLVVNGLTPVNNRPANDLSFRNGEVNMVTPLTDSEIGTPTSDDSPVRPSMPCSCGCGDYWLTDWNTWLCSRCHPIPNKMVRHTAISA
ncbi:MAG: winged helix-turn-helix domain-containing protein, partial [Dehalococcoidia bacterium]|nr:winged helix-turn-helix domain-containing protein [Dehalococcoidia bacterium]